MVNTGGKGGHSLTKRFRVNTNDPKAQEITLVVTGKVDAYFTVSPERVRIVGRLGEALSQEVRIVPSNGKTITIKKAKARRGENIDVALKPLNKKSTAEGYVLTVTVTKKDVGGFGDTVLLETDLDEQPTITIPVSGRLYAKDASTEKN